MISNTTFAQSLELEKGQLEKGSSKYDPEILGEDDSYVYVVYESKIGEYTAEVLDKKNKLKSVRTIDLESPKSRGLDINLKSYTAAAGVFNFFYTSYDKKGNSYELFVKRVSGADGQVIEQHKTLNEVAVLNKREIGYHTILFSEDDTKTFIYYKPAGTSVVLGRATKLYDEDYNLLVEKEFNAEEQMPRYFIVDNDGSIYFVRFGSSESTFTIGTYDAFADYELWEEEIEFKEPYDFDYVMTNGDLDISANQELVFTGLTYRDRGQALNSLVGAFYVSIDYESKEVNQAKLSTFDDEFFEQYANDKRQNKVAKKATYGTDGITAEFDFSDSYSRADGGTVMVLEEYSYVITYDGNGNVVGKAINYGDLLAMSFSPEGDLVWVNRAPKQQYFYYSGSFMIFSSRGFRFLVRPDTWKTIRHFSYSCTFHDDKLVLLFNDNFKNIGQDVNVQAKRLKNPNKAVVTKVEIDMESGALTRSQFPALNGTKTTLFPDKTYQKDENSDAILFGSKGSNHRYDILKAK